MADEIKYCPSLLDGSTSFLFDHVRIHWNEQVEFHRQQTWELSYVIKGSGIRVVGNKAEPFQPGEVILIPPHVPHCWSFDEFGTGKDGKIENISVMIPDTLLVTCGSHFPELGEAVSAVRSYGHAVSFSGSTLKQLQAVLRGMVKEPAIERFASLVRLLGILSSAATTHMVGQLVVEDNKAQRLQQVYMYLVNHYQDNITLTDVARLVGLDRSSFCIFFKKMTGKSFVTFLTEYRIESSCQLLLHTKLTVAEICIATGFRDIPYYNRVFKKLKGETPSEFRKRGNK
ncbi:MAG: AraC family transcriptional regulator [Tannerellaceae bacterium]|nr:AraC family transcriptional regulator [Tannerellaceae bacterium]